MRSGRLGQETLTGNFLSILETLVRNQVEFIVVGGIAAGLRGAPVMTLDLDVSHSADPANVSRILTALESTIRRATSRRKYCKLGPIFRAPESAASSAGINASMRVAT